MKLLRDHPLWRRRAPALAKTLAQAYLRTCSPDLIVRPEVKDLIFSGQPLIYTVWHCHLLFPLYYVRRYYRHLPPLVVMASPSKDGEFIGEVARGLGFTVCFGSRRKGGVQALRQMVDYFRRGYSCGLIADGSRGPARVAQKGPLYLARGDPGSLGSSGSGQPPENHLQYLGPLRIALTFQPHGDAGGRTLMGPAGRPGSSSGGPPPGIGDPPQSPL